MILYDLGCFNGDSALHFMGDHNIDRIEAYDPNPNYKDLWEAISKHYPTVRFHNKAVSDYTGQATYNLRPTDKPLGSTITKDKCDFADGKKMTVECVDIADIINGPCWIKADLEGEEFKVFERLIETNKLRHIKRIYLEWHTTKLKGDYHPRQVKINQELEKLNIEVRNW